MTNEKNQFFTHQNEERAIIFCDAHCHDEYFRIERDADWDSDEMYYVYVQLGYSGSFWNRLQNAWKILRRGYTHNDIVLGPGSIKAMVAWLTPKLAHIPEPRYDGEEREYPRSDSFIGVV
jgi:hypothetical protein